MHLGKESCATTLWWTGRSLSCLLSFVLFPNQTASCPQQSRLL